LLFTRTKGQILTPEELRQFLRPVKYALPLDLNSLAHTRTQVGLAVDLNVYPMLVEYDAMGRFVIPDGLARNVAVSCVCMPEAPPDEQPDETGFPVSEDLGAQEEDVTGFTVGRQGESLVGARGHVILVVDGLGQGELETLLVAGKAPECA